LDKRLGGKRSWSGTGAGIIEADSPFRSYYNKESSKSKEQVPSVGPPLMYERESVLGLNEA